jgi:hypothetical protein
MTTCVQQQPYTGNHRLLKPVASEVGIQIGHLRMVMSEGTWDQVNTNVFRRVLVSMSHIWDWDRADHDLMKSDLEN